MYKKAAEKDDKDAQNNLAVLYENGDGIDKDIDKAIYWYKKSAEQGFQDAQNKLKILSQKQQKQQQQQQQQ